jgi:hypothetical protein
MLDFTSAKILIKDHMPVVCSDNGQLAVVDHLDGTDTIKLARDAEGEHHYIPLTWVSSVDDKVHLDRTGDQVMKEWSRTPATDTATNGAETNGAAHHVNSSDATMGQPIAARVMTRKHELEAALAALPAEDLRARGDLELALSTIGELLTGDLTNVPAVVAFEMNRWLENNKHLAESAIVAAPVVVAVDDLATGPVIGPLSGE